MVNDNISKNNSESGAQKVPNGQKSIKMIEEEHFPILCHKIDMFKDDIGLLEAFIAGIIAAHDYSIISMIFRKI